VGVDVGEETRGTGSFVTGALMTALILLGEACRGVLR
jgi:hypothetical protein